MQLETWMLKIGPFWLVFTLTGPIYPSIHPSHWYCIFLGYCCKPSLTWFYHPSIHPSEIIFLKFSFLLCEPFSFFDCCKQFAWKRMQNYCIYLLLLCVILILKPVYTSLFYYIKFVNFELYNVIAQNFHL